MIGITIIAFGTAAVVFNYLGGIVISKDKNYPLVGLITAILTISNNIELAGLIDLIRPNLSWKTEMELTKRSLTIFIWTILVFTKIAGYIYLSTKNELKDTIIMIASIEVVSYMVIEGFKYMFIDKLFYKLQKD